MLNAGAVFLLLSLFSISMAGEEITIIENPAKPPNENAGRVVQLKEVFRITDESGDFYFKYPHSLKVAPDETFFLVDNDEFLRFDAEGHFIENRFKKGQGPGECSRIQDYHFRENNIYIYTDRPYKIIITDLKGKLLNEYRANHRERFLRIFGLFKDKYWFAGTRGESVYKKNAGEITLNLDLSYINPAGKVEKTGLQLPEKWAIVQRESDKENLVIALNRVIDAHYVMDRSGSLFFMNSKDYLIRRVDLEKNKITGKFRRKYTPVPYKEKKLEEGETRRQLPKQDYFTDIQYLLLDKDEIWVFTSTLVPGKGLLVDVFSKEGNYRDNFYLDLPRISDLHVLRELGFTLHGDYLFTIETDEDDNPMIVKYKIGR